MLDKTIINFTVYFIYDTIYIVATIREQVCWLEHVNRYKYIGTTTITKRMTQLKDDKSTLICHFFKIRLTGSATHFLCVVRDKYGYSMLVHLIKPAALS